MALILWPGDGVCIGRDLIERFVLFQRKQDRWRALAHSWSRWWCRSGIGIAATLAPQLGLRAVFHGTVLIAPH